jgi:DNA-binding NtrC family response regulator
LKSVESEPYKLAGLRVIIIEDESMLAFCLGEVVEEEGCVVAGMAETVADARTLVATTAFDVAIIDLHLRDEKADDLAASIVRGGHAIIISTGSDASKVPAEFHEWPILRKPFTDAAIFSAIKAAAATRSLQAGAQASLGRSTVLKRPTWLERRGAAGTHYGSAPIVSIFRTCSPPIDASYSWAPSQDYECDVDKGIA